jgi:hypothetical protein
VGTRIAARQAATAFQRGDEFFQIEIPQSSVTGFTDDEESESTPRAAIQDPHGGGPTAI